MRSNTIIYSWKRSVPGREHLSAVHFADFASYLGSMQKQGVIQSFEPILLDPNGDNIVGFFLIRMGDAGIGQWMDRADFTEHIIRSMFHVEEPNLSHGVSGPAVMERMDKWAAYIPS